MHGRALRAIGISAEGTDVHGVVTLVGRNRFGATVSRPQPDG